MFVGLGSDPAFNESASEGQYGAVRLPSFRRFASYTSNTSESPGKGL